MSTFVSSSMRVRLNLALPPFIISFVSRPANTTSPKHQAVLRRTQPRSSTLSLSSENDSLRHDITPSNLLSTLFGGSHITSAEKRNRVFEITRTTTVLRPLYTLYRGKNVSRKVAYAGNRCQSPGNVHFMTSPFRKMSFRETSVNSL